MICEKHFSAARAEAAAAPKDWQRVSKDDRLLKRLSHLRLLRL
jgi:hypothetical protein